ncbi:hypothetical protein [Nonomuraea aridisoli]|nr:hypothetical protein [Nonomuraea aridisoli]
MSRVRVFPFVPVGRKLDFYDGEGLPDGAEDGQKRDAFRHGELLGLIG